MADAHPDGRGDQLLLGDEDLEEAIGIGLGELLRKGGIADLAVHRDHRWSGTQRRERIPVGLARGHLVTFLIGGEPDLDPGVPDGGLAGIRLQAIDPELSQPAHLRDGALGHIGR